MYVKYVKTVKVYEKLEIILRHKRITKTTRVTTKSFMFLFKSKTAMKREREIKNKKEVNGIKFQRKRI